LKVSVVIPTLNEEEGIGATIDDIPVASMKKAGYDVEILVIDGNSKDKTREIAESRGAKVIVEKRKGYGRAYKTGFKNASGDIIVTGDADCTYPFRDIEVFVKMVDEKNVDFITTNRFAGLEKGSMKFSHHIGNFGLNMAVAMLFLIPLKDSQSGMWIFRRSALDKLVLTSDGMPLSEEIKIEAFRKLKAIEVPITYKRRVGEVKLWLLKDGVKNLLFIAKKRISPGKKSAF
jgi:glycosyltransferase involved in cell wall biosynthesis